jgi:RNA polymerase sigma-70 factor, ECF subfamily
MINRLVEPASFRDSPPYVGSITDEEAVRRILAGDKAAFELLMRRYNQRLFRIIRSIVPEDDEAEDAVQQAYVHAFQNLSQFAGNARFSTWLSKIAVNEALARRRRRQRVHVVDFSDPKNVSLEPSMEDHQPEDRACLDELGAVLTRAIDELPEELRTVFTLRVIEETDAEETAECLGLSEANVKIRLHRARALLKEKIDKRIGLAFERSTSSMASDATESSGQYLNVWLTGSAPKLFRLKSSRIFRIIRLTKESYDGNRRKRPRPSTVRSPGIHCGFPYQASIFYSVRRLYAAAHLGRPRQIPPSTRQLGHVSGADCHENPPGQRPYVHAGCRRD